MATMTENTTDPKAIVIDWIDHILKQKRWTGTDLARHSELAPSTVLRLLNDTSHKFVPSLKTLQKIANGSGYPIPRSVTAVLGATRFDEPDEDSPRSRKPSNEASLARSRPTIDVRHVSALPSALHPTSRPEISVAAPFQLEGDETAFAFYMPDASLDPWIKAGSLLYATKRRDPIPGDLVLITDKNGRSRVRLMMLIDENGVSLSESMPAKADDQIGFDDLQDIAVVALIAKI